MLSRSLSALTVSLFARCFKERWPVLRQVGRQPSRPRAVMVYNWQGETQNGADIGAPRSLRIAYVAERSLDLYWQPAQLVSISVLDALARISKFSLIQQNSVNKIVWHARMPPCNVCHGLPSVSSS